MNIRQTIQMLERYAEEHGDETELRIMTQQQWPFENHVLGLTTNYEMADRQRESEEPDEDDDPELGSQVDMSNERESAPIVFLVEGGQICYGSKTAWETARASY